VCVFSGHEYAFGFFKQMGEYFEKPSRFLLIFSLILHNPSIASLPFSGPGGGDSTSDYSHKKAW
jgi:hypothetical protein